MIRKLIIGFIIIAVIYFVYPNNNEYSFFIMEGTKYETKVFVNDSGKAGHTAFIIAGIHGNEAAGVYVCDSLKSFSPKRGRLVILPRANKIACDNEKRTMHFMQDLNREFLGKENGTDTQKLAWDITKAIKKYKPEVIIDLHESSNAYSEGEDFLGNSVIFTPTDSSAEIVMNILENINIDIETNLKFTCFSGAPEGSINREISNVFNIPVITVETNMKLPIEVRKKQHLDIIKIILKYYGMDD